MPLPSTFLTLPLELRPQIYLIVMDDHKARRWDIISCCYRVLLQIPSCLRLDRQITHEAETLFYSTITFTPPVFLGRQIRFSLLERECKDWKY